MAQIKLEEDALAVPPHMCPVRILPVQSKKTAQKAEQSLDKDFDRTLQTGENASSWFLANLGSQVAFCIPLMQGGGILLFPSVPQQFCLLLKPDFI